MGKRRKRVYFAGGGLIGDFETRAGDALQRARSDAHAVTGECRGAVALLVSVIKDDGTR